MKKLTLKKISAFIIVAMMFSANAIAQIVYTDVTPDATTTCPCVATYYLDINQDGINDFKITLTHKASTVVCTSSYGGDVSITALNSNKVLTNSTGVFVSKLSLNTPINSGSATWSNSGRLRSVSWSHSIMFGCYPNSYGSWSTTADGYAALQLKVGTQFYYGWVRVSLTFSTSFGHPPVSFTVKDYAYDTTPNHSILAGTTSGARLAEENSFEEIAFSLTAYPNPVSNSTTISFSLSQSQNVSLKVFDMAGRLVVTLADGLFNEGKNKIGWNVAEENAGIYFLKFESGNYSETKKISVIR